MSKDKTLSASEADKILKEARERFQAASDAEREMRARAQDDLRFLDGEQWDSGALKSREGRPCLTINRLPQYVRQVVNEQRKTRPAIEVVPADSKAAPETAEVMQGMVRHIERVSKARIAYDTAFEYAVACSVGHFRATTDYVDPNGFEQDILIKSIENPFTVYRDPYSREIDHSDDTFTFITEYVDAKEFEKRYGFEPTKFADADEGNDCAQWFDNDRVMVAEYWRVIIEEDEIHATVTGEVIQGKPTPEQKALVVASRTVERKVVEQYLLTYDKVIRKSAWLGQYIPVFTTYGGVMNIDGKRSMTSLIRWAKDPQKMYNYTASAETEVTALQPKVPFIGAQGQFAGVEAQWARANVDNAAFLEYVQVEGAPPPQRQMPAPLPQGLREGRMAAAEDIKAAIGMYDASLGARSNETSGVAIKARQQEGDTGTYHFIDNHARSIEHCGRVLVDLIPKIYDTARVVRIIGPNDAEDVVAINQVFVAQDGREMMHDLSLGRYDVAVRVGPSFESKRQEMVEAMIEISARNPQILQIAGDLILKNMDWPEADEIAKRLWTLLPPQLKGEQQQPPPNPLAEAEKIKQGAAMQMKQMEAQLETQKFMLEMRAEMAKMQQETQASMAELQLKLSSAERIAAMNNATKTNVALANAEEQRILAGEEQRGENTRKLVDVLVTSAEQAQQDRHHRDAMLREQQFGPPQTQ